MKVSEAIDQLKTGDEVWVKGEVACINKSGVLPLCIKFAERTKVFVEADEISLTEPTKQVKIPEYVAEWIDYCKERGISLHTAMNHHSELLRRIEKTYKEMRSWLTGANYKKNEEIFARAWLDGFTVEPKRWVVKYIPPFVDEFRYYSVDDEIFDITESSWTSDKEDAYPFTDKKKAEAVATLVEGSVEEV